MLSSDKNRPPTSQSRSTFETRGSGSSLGFSSSSKYSSNGSVTSQSTYTVTSVNQKVLSASRRPTERHYSHRHTESNDEARALGTSSPSRPPGLSRGYTSDSGRAESPTPSPYDMLRRPGLTHKASGDASDSGGSFRFKKDSTEAREREKEKENIKRREKEKERDRERRGSGSSNRIGNFSRGGAQPREVVLKKRSSADKAIDRENTLIALERERQKLQERQESATQSPSVVPSVTESQSTPSKQHGSTSAQDGILKIGEEVGTQSALAASIPSPSVSNSTEVRSLVQVRNNTDAERIAAERRQEREKLVLALLGSLEKVAIPSPEQMSNGLRKTPDTVLSAIDLMSPGNRNSVEGLFSRDEGPRPRLQAVVEVDPFSLSSVLAARMSFSGAPPAPLLMPVILPYRDSVLSLVPESAESIVLRRISSHDWPDLLRLPQSPFVPHEDLTSREAIAQDMPSDDVSSPFMEPLPTPTLTRYSLNLEQMPVPSTPRIEPTTSVARRRRHSRSKPSISSSIGTGSMDDSIGLALRKVPSQVLGITGVTTTVERSNQASDRPISSATPVKQTTSLQVNDDQVPAQPLPLPRPLSLPPSPPTPPPAPPLFYVEPYEPLSPPKPRPVALEAPPPVIAETKPKQAERPLRSLNELTRKRQSSVDSLVHTATHTPAPPPPITSSKVPPKLSLDVLPARFPTVPSVAKASESAPIRSSPILASTNEVVRPFLADYSRHFAPKRSNSGPTTPGNADSSRPTTPAFGSALIHTPSPIIVPTRVDKEESVMIVPVMPAAVNPVTSFSHPPWREKGQPNEVRSAKPDQNAPGGPLQHKMDSPLEQLVEKLEEAERTAESRKNSAGHVTPPEEPFHPPSPSPYIRQADDRQPYLPYTRSIVDSPDNLFANAALAPQPPSTSDLDVSGALESLLGSDSMNHIVDFVQPDVVHLRTPKASTNLKSAVRENVDTVAVRSAVPVPSTTMTPTTPPVLPTPNPPGEIISVGRSARTLSNAKPPSTPLALRKPSTEHIPIPSRGSPLLPTSPPLPSQAPTEPNLQINPPGLAPPSREAQKSGGIGRSLRATSPTPPPKHESLVSAPRSAVAAQLSSSSGNRVPSPVKDLEQKPTSQRPLAPSHTRTTSKDSPQETTSRSRSSPTPPSNPRHTSNQRSQSSQNQPTSKELPKIVPPSEPAVLTPPRSSTPDSIPKVAPPPPRKSHRSTNSADKDVKHSSKSASSAPAANSTSSSHHGHRKTKSAPPPPPAPVRPISPVQESPAGTPSSLSSSVSDFHQTVLAAPPKKTTLFNFWKKNESAPRLNSRDPTSAPPPVPQTQTIGPPMRKLPTRPKEPIPAPVSQRNNNPPPIQAVVKANTQVRSSSPALKVVATAAAVSRTNRPSSKDKGLLSSLKMFGGRRAPSTISNASMEAVLGYSSNAPNSPAPSSPEIPHSPFPSRDPASAVREWRRRDAAIQTSRTRRPRPGVTWELPGSPTM